MAAMVAMMVASCRTNPTTPGVVARAIVTARITSTWATAAGATTAAAAAAEAVLCLLGLLINI